MTFRYIGSKARMAGPLADAIEAFDDGTGRFVDAFSGSGVVSELAASLGWPVWANDTLESAAVMTTARLVSVADVRMERLGGYAGAVERLNKLKPSEGPMWRIYSPASAYFDPDRIERRYFTERNAAAIDAARAQIAEWGKNGLLTPREEQLLIADLISAANRVANIAGTYGCFLSTWQNSTHQPLQLRPRELKNEPVEFVTTVADVAEVRPASTDLVYLDPPYTKRQYASYYHILETIAVGDEPEVEGVSGLRPWKDKASVFCYKKRALRALVSLVERIASRRVLISYSCEGHVDLNDLRAGLETSGRVECAPVQGIGRYRPNRTASANGNTVTEYVLSFTRCDDRVRANESALSGGCQLQELAT
ncbi:MAG: methyltransferase [Alphaproteobacteria bacterium]|nr:methyltransferase [Alphaproteobacteria bacterium]